MVGDLPQLRVPLAVDRDELLQVTGNDRELLAHVPVMVADDVVRQFVDRPRGARSVVRSRRNGELHQLGADSTRGQPRGRARFSERSLAATAEIEAEPVEDAGGTEVSGDDVAEGVEVSNLRLMESRSL